MGTRLPADITCIDDGGRRRPLGELMDRPVILSLVYDQCTRFCPQVQVGLGRLIQSLDLTPGRDYRIVTFSFDPEDGPEASAVARKNYTLPLGKDLPDGAWTFVTASAPDIARLTSALGFSYQKAMHGFSHPVILALIAPGGRISRYILPSRYAYGAAYPITFSPAELGRYIDEAGRGLIAGPPSGPPLFCFESEPPGQARYDRLTKTLGIVTLICLAAFFAYLVLARRRA